VVLAGYNLATCYCCDGVTNTMRNLAVIMLVVGVGILIWGAFGFVTKKKVVDIGPLDVTKNEEHNVPYGPLAGGLLAAGGVVLLLKAKK
jgi:hypothetical protein